MDSRPDDSARTQIEENPSTGGKPQTIGRCTECEAIYLVQTEKDDDLRPIGTDGSCGCGNDEFIYPFESE